MMGNCCRVCSHLGTCTVEDTYFGKRYVGVVVTVLRKDERESLLHVTATLL